MGEFVEVTEARKLSGLRLVLSLGVPGPWSEAAKGILYVKKIPYVRVRQEIGGANTELTEWTAQATAPVAIWNDEPPRSTWIEQLFLAERLEPTPALIPDNIEDRMLMFGHCNELCGEHGYGWSKRLMLLHTVLTDSDADDSARAFATHLGNKYGYTREEAEAAPARVANIVTTLGSRLEQQQNNGNRFLSVTSCLLSISIGLRLPRSSNRCRMNFARCPMPFGPCTPIPTRWCKPR